MCQEQPQKSEECSPDLTRRTFVETAIAGAAVIGSTAELAAQTAAPEVKLTLNINGQPHMLAVETRVSLLDALRERLYLTGTKKGCDHGQCGACTVLVNGRRVNSCLLLAVMLEGDEITTVEGLAKGDDLHPVQAAFIEHDGFQCGYCTPGQIMSAVALLTEAKANTASAATPDVTKLGPVDLTDDEIRERMSGNICRCGAYPNIVAAVHAAHRMNGGQA